MPNIAIISVTTADSKYSRNMLFLKVGSSLGRGRSSNSTSAYFTSTSRTAGGSIFATPSGDFNSALSSINYSEIIFLANQVFVDNYDGKIILAIQRKRALVILEMFKRSGVQTVDRQQC